MKNSGVGAEGKDRAEGGAVQEIWGRRRVAEVELGGEG